MYLTPAYLSVEISLNFISISRDHLISFLFLKARSLERTVHLHTPIHSSSHWNLISCSIPPWQPLCLTGTPDIQSLSYLVFCLTAERTRQPCVEVGGAGFVAIVVTIYVPTVLWRWMKREAGLNESSHTFGLCLDQLDQLVATSQAFSLCSHL